MKDRDISTLDFLNALQRELICLEIRKKIYVSRNDKEYFSKLIDKKQKTIRSLCQRNNLPSILDDDSKYLDVWRQIVPNFGFPNLIYNIVGVSEEQLRFPYRGTVVRMGDEYGIAHRVDFEEHVVEVIVRGAKEPIAYDRSEVVRVSHRESDEYFYYYPGNSFNTRENGLGELESYDMKTKLSKIIFEGGSEIVLPQKDISRIL